MTRTNRKQWEEKMKQRMSAYREQMAFLVKEEKKAEGGTKRKASLQPRRV